MRRQTDIERLKGAKMFVSLLAYIIPGPPAGMPGMPPPKEL